MLDYQREFIEFALQHKVLRFGEFILKSGRKSPYFFNAGLFNSGASLGRLGEYYARTIVESGIAYDMLFGPAYKGIPLATAAAIALARLFGRDVPYCFNRKEAKDHGEGGMTVGSPLSGRVLIIDDVVSAGTSVNESVQIIRSSGATPAGVVIAVDRQERGSGPLSAVQEVRQRHGIDVASVINLETMLEFLKASPGSADFAERVQAYRRAYGV
ncbi:MAG: Orotate phosphoribosyltransferase [Gammaproteobacteria bacterium]|nr:Orotate phosphoribosyltransferase [Gammaproteobacteria bacterium]